MAAKKAKKKAAPKKKVQAKAKPKSKAKISAKSNLKAKSPKAKVAIKKAIAPKMSPQAKSNKIDSSGLVPSRDGVLVERVQEHDRTPGGLYIPTSAMEKPLKGIVVRAGKGKFSKRGKLRPLDVQPGDEVLFGKYAGTEIKIDGKEYLLVREDEILGVVS